jgi:hypothetical protein
MFLYREVMLRFAETRHRVFRKHWLIAKLISAASSRLHAEIRRYSAHYDRVNSPAPQLLIQLSAIKGTPLPF